MKRIVSVLLVVLLFSSCVGMASAAKTLDADIDVVYFEDGSYLTTELIIDNVVATRASYSISGHKNANYANASGELQWTFTVYGTFTYDGTTATATQASYGYQIYNDGWTLKSATAYCSGNQAIAEGTFKGGFLLNRSTTVTLTCSPSGVLS